MTSYRAARDVAIASGAYNLRAFDTLSDNFKATLGGYNQTAADSHKDVMTEAKDDIESYQSKDPNAWELKLEKSREDSKKAANDLIDSVYDKGINFIRQSVPDSQKDNAANFFVMCSDKAMEVAEQVWSALQQAFNYIADFVKRIFDWIRGAWNTVKNVATSVIDTIGRWITGRSSVVRSHKVTYTGHVYWPRTSANTGTVMAAAAYISSQLEDAGIDVVQVMATVDSVKGKAFHSLAITIASDREDLAQLSGTWKKRAKNLGGHIPEFDADGSPTNGTKGGKTGDYAVINDEAA